jgi:hypothetical protein
MEKIESPASRGRLEALWLNLLTVLESSIRTFLHFYGDDTALPG